MPYQPSLQWQCAFGTTRLAGREKSLSTVSHIQPVTPRYMGRRLQSGLCFDRLHCDWICARICQIFKFGICELKARSPRLSQQTVPGTAPLLLLCELTSSSRDPRRGSAVLAATKSRQICCASFRRTSITTKITSGQENVRAFIIISIACTGVLECLLDFHPGHPVGEQGARNLMDITAQQFPPFRHNRTN